MGIVAPSPLRTRVLWGIATGVVGFSRVVSGGASALWGIVISPLATFVSVTTGILCFA